MKSIAKPSKNTEPPSTTVDPSKASSSARDHRGALGLLSEQKVIEHFLKQGFLLHQQRMKSPYGEIDLVFRWNKQQNSQPKFQQNAQLNHRPRSRQERESFDWLLVEVKSQKLSRNGEVPIQQSQIGRLQRAWLWFCGKHGASRFHLAIVNESGKSTVIEDFFTTIV